MAYKEPLIAAAENTKRWASEAQDPQERADLLRLARDLEAEGQSRHEPRPSRSPSLRRRPSRKSKSRTRSSQRSPSGLSRSSTRSPRR